MTTHLTVEICLSRDGELMYAYLSGSPRIVYRSETPTLSDDEWVTLMVTTVAETMYDHIGHPYTIDIIYRETDDE